MAQMCPDSDVTVSMLEALKMRYTTESTDEQQNNNCEIVLARPRNIYHSDSLHIPCSVNLDSLCIASAGDFVEMCELCSHINELSLSSNQLTSLKEIIHIMTATPKLEFLNLKSNPLQNDLMFPNQDELSSSSSEKQETIDDLQVKQVPLLPVSNYSFPNLNFLVLNDTQITWSALHQLLLICPKIQELHLSLIGFKEVDLPAEFSYGELLRLHFNYNQITDWNKLLQLGYCFPKLEKLVMSDTAFNSLPEQSQCVSAFPELLALSISNNCLNDWEEVEKLCYFPKLKQVRLNGSKILKDYIPKECTAFLIARLPNIQILNGREVTDKEREDAERFFLRYYQDAENKPYRYNELRLLHGDLKPLLDLNLCDDGLKVIMVFLDKSQEMILDGKKTVKELKVLLKDFVGHPPSKFRLLHFTKSPEPAVLAIMDASNRSLHSFRIQENDEIHIQLK